MTFPKTHITKRALLTSVLVVGFLGAVGCTTKSGSSYLVENSNADDYVYIIDYDKIALIEATGNTSHSNLDTIWVNPPVKRIKRSELDKMKNNKPE